MFFGRTLNQYEFGTTFLFRASILACFVLNLMNFLSFVFQPIPKQEYSFFCNPLSDIDFYLLFPLILAAIFSLISVLNILIFGSNFKQPKQQFTVYLQNVALLFAIFLLASITLYIYPAHLTNAYYCGNLNYFFKTEMFLTFMGIICGIIAVYEVRRVKLIKKVFVILHCYEI